MVARHAIPKDDYGPDPCFPCWGRSRLYTKYKTKLTHCQRVNGPNLVPVSPSMCVWNNRRNVLDLAPYGPSFLLCRPRRSSPVLASYCARFGSCRPNGVRIHNSKNSTPSPCSVERRVLNIQCLTILTTILSFQCYIRTYKRINWKQNRSFCWLRP